MIPGAEEVLALLELRQHALSDAWDVIVVDCAPTAETLRLLALPEALGWYMTRVFPVERRVVKALRPVLSRAAGVPMPEDDVFAAVERLHARARPGACAPDRPRHQRPSRADAGAGRPGRGPPQLHDALPVRLPRGRRRRQPGLPRGRRRPVARGVGGCAGRRARRRWRTRSPTSRCGVRSTARPSRSGWPSSRRFGRQVYGDLDPLAVPAAREPLRVTRTTDGAVLHLRLPVRRTGGRRPREGRRRSGRDRGVVSSSPHPSGRAGPPSGRRCPRGRGRAAGEVRRGETVRTEVSGQTDSAEPGGRRARGERGRGGSEAVRAPSRGGPRSTATGSRRSPTGCTSTPRRSRRSAPGARCAAPSPPSARPAPRSSRICPARPRR